MAQAGTQLGVSVNYVHELNAAMEKISGSSTEISKIIDTIENIAFQTNILALKRRCGGSPGGSAGKSVCSWWLMEVRTLASKSDEAAKATKELIEGSITAVAEGGQVVAKVTESLDKTSSIAENVTIKSRRGCRSGREPDHRNLPGDRGDRADILCYPEQLRHFGAKRGYRAGAV